MGCIACSNKLASSTLKTIQGERYSIYCYYHPLYRSRGISGLVETHGNSRAQKNVFEPKYYTKLSSPHLEGKLWGFNDITYVKLLSKWKKKMKIQPLLSDNFVFLFRQLWKDATDKTMLWLEFR